MTAGISDNYSTIMPTPNEWSTDMISPLWCWIYSGKRKKNIFVLLSILKIKVACNQNPSKWKTGKFLSYPANITVATNVWTMKEPRSLAAKGFCHVCPEYVGFRTTIAYSFIPERCNNNLKSVYSEHMLETKSRSSSCEIALRWVPYNTLDDRFILIQVMAWCRQETRHYVSKCWYSSM